MKDFEDEGRLNHYSFKLPAFKSLGHYRSTKDYVRKLAYVCVFVFVCFRILCLGLEHVLIQCLIEFRLFRLLIHKVSSPNVLTMPLYVLLRCVDFIDDFRDDFSTVFQSCIVVFVRERVTIRNPKMDSNSEFGRSRYGPTNRGYAGEDSPGRGPHGLAVVEAVGPTAWSTFCSRVGHAPPTAWG
ncbi:hypothetical protein Q3G72_007356 [Acer saccharum]|nr:hypothetical protein Q3G72_007356 [Acer saccharum]